MKFAFLVHPLTANSGALLGYLNQDGMQGQWGTDPLALCQTLHRGMQASRRAAREQVTAPRIIDELGDLYSATGGDAEGVLIEIPMDSVSILEQPDRAVAYIEQAAELAIDWGARLIGLGSMTGIVGGRGTHLAERVPVAVTTGNSLTVYAAYRNLLRACAEFEIDLARETVAIVGVPGSIASALAGLVQPLCGRLILVGRQASGPARKLAQDLGAELVTEVSLALSQARVVISATSTGGCIEQTALLPGSVVIDVGVPTDVQGTGPERGDVLFLSGGLTRLPDNCRGTRSKVVWFQQGLIPSCLGETMLLAMEGREECLSLGRVLDLDAIREIGKTAERAGFDFTKLVSFGRSLDDSQMTRFLKVCARRRTPKPGRSPALPQPADLAGEAAARHGRHINPVMIAAGKRSGFVKTFVRGEGMYLWDADGRRYLDYVGGFGSVNLGHNHPAVSQACVAALAAQAPGFAQSAVNPYAAALARELASVSPAGLEMTFFCNSGAEANEAALKLARAATGRAGLLACETSYHGKTLGTLSVTGNAEYRKPFGPLVPESELVPFGDISALARALSTRKFAAFLVEPLQAEGGMNVPPAGYLHEAEALCRAAGTLLIVDEVQTGMGRTGALFASERAGISPDILTLAKSLGGGVMPLGAMLCRREHWLKAYGTLQSFALHTSTFSGGSLACAAGLASLRATIDEELAARAEERGAQLMSGLRAIAAEYPGMIRDVRGSGLLVGIEFQKLPPALVGHWKGIDQSGMAQYIVPNSDRMIEAIPVLFTMQALLDHYGIYTQVARSNPFVLRVQPPLVVSAEQIDEFLHAVEEICDQMVESNRLVEGMLAKTITGQHDAGQRGGGGTTESRISNPEGLMVQ